MHEDDLPVHADHRIQHQFPQNVRFCALCGNEMRMRTVLPDHKRYKVCGQCGYVHFPGPKLVAGCLIIEAGRVLLLRRGIEPRVGKWTFPGGYVDLGESPAEAALRETREEVGMRVELGRVLGVYTDPAHPISAVVAYMAKPGIEEASVTDEATEVRYFRPSDIPWDEIAFATTRDALRDWLAEVDLGRMQ
ncbi:MAG TPA: NUDIX hydrolase [Candidatus Binataceae bacterium]|nr:NUDIX hydrolase [Candidatus Binataceae bacterium]